MSTVARSDKMVSLMVVLAGIFSLASADSASIYPVPGIPSWAQASTMSLELGTPPFNIIATPFEVLPLTPNVGLNQTVGGRSAILITGDMVSVNVANYVGVTSPTMVAYLSCDPVNNSNIGPNMMINALMANNLKAILLYSSSEDSCWLDGSNLEYTSIFTMADKMQAIETLNLTMDGALNATIVGNYTGSSGGDGGSDNSAVAMSILYSITGLITLLFLIIITTGAIRAHRYPERYGPRSANGGRPRQSRARGLARAVLETLPIVKFGDPTPTKPDPAVELEDQLTTASQDVTMGTALSAAHEDMVSTKQNGRGEEPAAPGARPTGNSLAVVVPAEEVNGMEDQDHGKQGEEDHPGCSICTEDFMVGEDVRVLPCDHKFHPQCIDPWLIDVSGTCPLCRLDLRPQSQQEHGVTAEDLLQLPPPLEVDMSEQQESGTPGVTRSRRLSRLPDLHRLRHASVEERIEILRRHRSQQGQTSTTRIADGDVEDRGRRARLTDRLRERFRIRTGAQAPAQTASQASPRMLNVVQGGESS